MIDKNDLNQKQKDLLDYVMLRKCTIKELCAFLNVTPRNLRLLKEQLIDLGFPVGSTHGDDKGTGGGYYYIYTVQHLEEAQAEMRSKALNMLHKVRQLEDNFIALNPAMALAVRQIPLFSDDDLSELNKVVIK